MGLDSFHPNDASIKKSMEAIEIYTAMALAKKEESPRIILKLEGEGKKQYLKCINFDELSAPGRALLRVKMQVNSSDYKLQNILSFVSKLPTGKQSEILENVKKRLDDEIKGETKSAPVTQAVFKKTIDAKLISFIQTISEKDSKSVDIAALKKQLADLEIRYKNDPGLALAREMISDLEKEATKPVAVPAADRPIYKKPNRASAEINDFIQNLPEKYAKGMNVDNFKKQLATLESKYKENPLLVVAHEMVDELDKVAIAAILPPAPPPVRAEGTLQLHPIVGQGIYNAGNSCYLNSTLQALRACEPFRQHLISTKLTPPQDALGKALLEINSLPPATMRQFWQQMLSLKLQEPGKRAAFIDLHITQFGIPREQVQALKGDLLRFSSMGTEERKQYLKPPLQDSIVRLYKDLETSSRPLDAERSHCLRLLAIATGFAEQTVMLRGERVLGSQEDAVELCEKLLDTLDFPDVSWSTAIDYPKEQLGYRVPAIERALTPNQTKCVPVAISDADPNTSVQKLFDASRILEEHDKEAILQADPADWPLTEAQRAKLIEELALEKAAQTGKRRDIPKIETTQTIQLIDPPPALLPISLKRFTFIERTMEAKKLGKVLPVPDTLEVPMAGENRRAQYELVSAVIHVGGESASSGHYYAFSNIDMSVNEFNDSTVAPMQSNPMHATMNHNGYLFFYKFTGYS